MKANLYKITFKDESKKTDYAGAIREIFERYSYEELGCVIGTVTNAMSKNVGAYENDYIRIVKISTASLLEELLPDNVMKAII